MKPVQFSLKGCMLHVSMYLVVHIFPVLERNVRQTCGRHEAELM